jgi:cytidyltransferase-like protein
MRIVACAGNFDPYHKGHAHLFKAAKALGDYVLVILARDDQMMKKKGYVFMSYEERKEVLKSVRWVDEVAENVDEDISCRKSLAKYQPNIYVHGGDLLDKDHLVESEVCKALGIEIKVGVGGTDKEQSSSRLVGRM